MITFVQAASFPHGSPSLLGVTAGSTLIGVVLWATAPGPAPIDNHGQTWLPATQPWSGQQFGQTINPYLQMFYTINVAAGHEQISFPSTYEVMESSVLEYSGITKFVKGVGNAGFGGTSPFTTPNINTNMNDLLVAVGISSGTSLLPTAGLDRCGEPYKTPTATPART
jgi:hypothetical protein